MGLKVVSGRGFVPADALTSDGREGAVVVSESLARLVDAGGHPIGRTLDSLNVGISLLLLGLAVLVALGPAREAARVDAMRVLEEK